MMLSITGVADCCIPSCQGDGCPNSANAAPPPARMAKIVTANAVIRLNTSIVGIAPSNEALRRPPHRSPPAGAAPPTCVDAAPAEGHIPPRFLGARATGPSGESRLL